MRKNEKKGKNTKIALIFFLIVFFFVAVSLILKFIQVLKNSSFDGSHSYNLAIIEEKNSWIISFSPEAKSISILDVRGKTGEESLNHLLNLPIDAVIKRDDLKIENSNIASNLFKVFFSSFNLAAKPTFIDIFRLALFAKSVPQSSVFEKSVNVNADDLVKQQIVSSIFLDSTIVSEKKTIEIINATDTSGLGARLAALVNNIGGDIVLVVTSEKNENNSKVIYYGDDSYTVDRLSSIFDFPKVRKNGGAIADVIIVIGNDSVDSKSF